MFAFQPKRLPKDVDRLRFFQGSIVRKKSLGAKSETDEEENAAKEVAATEATERFDPPQRSTAGSVFRSASVHDLRTTVLKERERSSEGGNSKDSSPLILKACLSMSSLNSARRPEVPPPLPAFPSGWKIQVTSKMEECTSASCFVEETKSARDRIRSESNQQVVAAAGKAVFAAALEGGDSDHKGTGMVRSPSMPLPRRPSAPREKRRPRPGRAEVCEVESTPRESGASPSSGCASSRAAPSPVEANAETEVQKASECADRSNSTLDTFELPSANSSQERLSLRRPPLPPPLPVPPIPLRRLEGAPATLVEAASAQAALLSPARSARRAACD